MSADWYEVEEIRRWTEADERGFGQHAEWLAAQLNAAYRKGMQHGGELQEEALRCLSEDMHMSSSRPCATCRVVSAAIGKPFGCIVKAKSRARQQST